MLPLVLDLGNVLRVYPGQKSDSIGSEMDSSRPYLRVEVARVAAAARGTAVLPVVVMVAVVVVVQPGAATHGRPARIGGPRLKKTKQ